ncbi:endonuclease/exonuclease/phosphatase family protein [candidate division KSB1 bacterium]|nr:endonuclease/exonuclease/phosphatase family protein [candidate division KSB1 bacterium]
MRVMTFNVRVNVASDSSNAWPNRKDIAASMIRFHNADIIGLQEALKEQVDDLAIRLPEYKWFGIGRDDGKDAGEFMAIFYRSERFDVLTDSTFWLSETPGKPGLGWDAACNRVVTFGKFKDKKTDKVFFLFNTHFDHMGQVARRESAKFLLQSVAEIGSGLPVIVTGDFNSTPDSEPYKILTQGVNGIKLIDSKSMSQYPHHGPTGTWTGFKTAYFPDRQPIDYIFIRNNVKVLLHGTLSDSFDGRFPTDHMPVLAEVIIE